METVVMKFRNDLLHAYENDRPIFMKMYNSNVEFLSAGCDLLKVVLDHDIIINTGECEINLGIFDNVKYESDCELYVFENKNIQIEIAF